MSEREHTDILVIGAGPCGLAVGVAAREAGLPCTILDKGPVTSAIDRYPLDMTFFSTPEHLELGDVPLVVDRDKPTRRDALTYYRRIARHFSLDVRQYEEVLAVERNGSGFHATSRTAAGDRREYAARAVVVATGYYDTPVLLYVPGEGLPKVTHYFRDAHRYFDQDVIVVGGGNSAVDAALSTWRAGARVTLVHQFDDFDRGVKPWVLPDIRNRLEKGEIAVRWRTRLAEIEPARVRLEHADGGDAGWVRNDFVLAMTGYRPDPKFLVSLGVPVDPVTGVPAHDPETLETPVAGAFVAGVIAAGFDANRIFIQNGREHGPRIVRALAARLVDVTGTPG
ncbi:MAG: YpdA family putative bacillithiol disulfide reductase [Gemmatimonadota bacterium]|nr:YpdA family putative bacillithiol disulfide reductase [Gemmatimonadota bacterium]